MKVYIFLTVLFIILGVGLFVTINSEDIFTDIETEDAESYTGYGLYESALERVSSNYTYNETNRKVRIQEKENKTDIATVQNLYPQSSSIDLDSACESVTNGIGTNCKVAEFEIEALTLERFNISNGVAFKDFDTLENRSMGFYMELGIPVGVINHLRYEEVCARGFVNNSKSCTSENTYNETSINYSFADFDGESRTGIYRVAMYVDELKNGERIEYIPEFFGSEINEWANFVGFTRIEWSMTTNGQNAVGDGAALAQNFTINTVGPAGNYTLEGISILAYKSGSGLPGMQSVHIYNATADGNIEKSQLIAYNNTWNATTLSTDSAGAWTNITFENNPGEIWQSGGTKIIMINNSASGSYLRWHWVSGDPYAGGNWMRTTDNWANYQRGTEDVTFQVFGTIIAASAPTFVNVPPNISRSFFDYTIGEDFNVSVPANVDTYVVNNTVDFAINNSGWLTNVSALAVGIHQVNITVNDTVNLQTSIVWQLNVTTRTAVGSLAITPSNTEVYLTETTATGSETNPSDGDVTYLLSRNDIATSNPDVITLGVAVWNYTFNTTGGQNWSATHIDSQLLTITQATGVVETYLNGARANLTVGEGTTVYLEGNLSAGLFGSLNLTIDTNTELNSSTSVNISNSYNFTTIGNFIINTSYSGNENYTADNEGWFVEVVDGESPLVSNVIFYAINYTNDVMGNETQFNLSYLDVIEHALINFTLTDPAGFTGDITFFYSGTGNFTCVLGNRQDDICYSSPDYIDVKNNTDTARFKDTGAIGDFINITYESTNTTVREYSILIDEHYNPNVEKHYAAGFNFSVIKYQDGASQKITKDNEIKVEFNSSDIPVDADEYKLDFMVNYSGAITQPLEAYACNSSYVTGVVENNINCFFIAEKLPSQLTGSKGLSFRSLFTKAQINNITEIKYIVLETDEINPNRYYMLETVNATTTPYTTKWEFSTDAGLSWANSGDGFETEMNINWFYETANGGTSFLMKVESTDSNGNIGNSSVYNYTWISVVPNLPLILDIIAPAINETISGTYGILWDTEDPNEGLFETNISIANSTYDLIIASNIPKPDGSGTETYNWATSVVGDGFYNLTIVSWENETFEMFQVNQTHEFKVNNTLPITPSTVSFINNNIPSTVPHVRLGARLSFR